MSGVLPPSSTRPTTRLRELLRDEDYLVMPGCYDALSSMLIQEAGFPGAAISGFAVEVAHLGYPDLGLMTLTELADQARRICAHLNIPVISDADTGFGGTQNIHRTVHELEQAGLAGVHIEDQTFPKQCPVIPGRTLVSIEEAADRYAIAAEARRDKDFVIIARTDGDSVSYDESVARAEAYLRAGADVVLPMMIEHDGAAYTDLNPDRQMELCRQFVADIDGPVMYVGDAPDGYSHIDVGQAGFKIVSPSLVTLDAAGRAVTEALHELKRTGSTGGYRGDLSSGAAAAGRYLSLTDVDFYLDLGRRPN